MGLGKTITLIALHLHRAEAATTGPTLVVCPASLLGNWEQELARFAPDVGAPLPRRTGRSPGSGGSCSRRTAPCARAREPRRVRWDLVVADEAQHVKNPAPSTAGRCAASRAGRVGADRHPGREQPHRALGDPRLGIPGLLGSRNAFRKRGPGHRVGPRADEDAQFAT
jgi:hypothetical protein